MRKLNITVTSSRQCLDDIELILIGVYMHKFSNIELIALRPSAMYAKTGVKTTIATSRTGALNWRADAVEKIRDPDSGARSCSDAQFLCAINI